MRSQMHKESIGEISELWDNKKRRYQNKMGFASEIECLRYIVWEDGQESENPGMPNPTR